MDQKLKLKLKRIYAQARFTMIAERVTFRSWRFVTWTLFFAALWLLLIPQSMGQIISAIIFIIFLIGICYFFHQDLRFLRWPSRREVERRLERDSNLEHRPLSGLSDSLANPGNTDSFYLWQHNLQRALKHLSKIRPALPRYIVALKDPFAVRFGILIFFGIALLLAGPDWKERLWSGVTPFSFVAGKKTAASIQMVITPPPYTGLPQITASAGKIKPLNVPAGSIIKATVNGGFGMPRMAIGKDNLRDFTGAGGSNYVLELAALPGDFIKITQMFINRAQWVYSYIPDQPPVITVKAPPEAQPDSSLRFPLIIADDYGVKSLSMHMELDERLTPPPIGKPIDERRAIQTPRGTAVEIQPLYDLASHPWAGLPVKITFAAEDDLHQKAVTQEMTLLLPEKHFTHPVAQELIALRAKLIAAPLAGYDQIRQELESVIMQPDKYQRDILVLMALRAAASRLFWGGVSTETAQGVIDLLWDTALRLEDGNFSIASRNLRNAQNELANALQNPGTSNEEISRLMQNLRDAMGQYFTELQRNLQKRMANGEQVPLASADMLAKMMNPEQLAAMLNQMESQMMSGDRKSAQQMLSQLQSMMENFGSATQQKLPPDMQAMIQAARDIEMLIGRQQALMDKTRADVTAGGIPRTFGKPLPGDEELMKQWGLKNMPPPPQGLPASKPAPNTQDKRTEQELIRTVLNQLMQKTGEVLNQIPPNMGQSEQEMRTSSAALDQNKPDDSIPHQQVAIDALRQSQQELGQAFTQRLKQMSGMAFSGAKMDPLGRPYGDNGGELFPGSTVKIPDETQRKEAQEIMRLLQQRSGEMNRPEPELDYYHRLLRQF